MILAVKSTCESREYVKRKPHIQTIIAVPCFHNGRICSIVGTPGKDFAYSVFLSRSLWTSVWKAAILRIVRCDTNVTSCIDPCSKSCLWIGILLFKYLGCFDSPTRGQ